MQVKSLRCQRRLKEDQAWTCWMPAMQHFEMSMLEVLALRASARKRAEWAEASGV